VGRPAREGPLEHPIADPLGAGRRRRVLITGAGGQLGTALVEAFSEDDVIALSHDDWDVQDPPPPGLPQPDLVLHAAAFTDVDLAERRPGDAHAVNDQGTANVVGLGAPVVYFSTDYVFDGEKRTPYVESDEPHPLSSYGYSKRAGERRIERGWIVRSSWLFAPAGRNFVRTILRLARERNEVAVVDDQRGCPTYVGHLAEAVRQLVELPEGTWHLAADGECTWFDFAQEIVGRSNLQTIVRPVSTEELGRPARRPAYSVLRSEKKQAPRLPHWREGLRDCLAHLSS
jgi:dTDP-4-dehydrorhamnose reductase